MKLGELMSPAMIKKLIETDKGIQLLRESVDPADREVFEETLKEMLELREQLKKFDKKMEESHGLYATNQEGKA